MNWTLLIPLIIAGYAALWVGISLLIAKVSGWSALAERYRTDPAMFTGWKTGFQSGRMRVWTRYGGALTVGANGMGFYLAVLAIFRAGHPPLFVPWHAIDVTQGTRFIYAYTTFHFREVPGVTLEVSRRLGDRVLEAGGEPARQRAVRFGQG